MTHPLRKTSYPWIPSILITWIRLHFPVQSPSLKSKSLTQFRVTGVFPGAQVSRVGASEGENTLMLLAPESSVRLGLQGHAFPSSISPWRVSWVSGSLSLWPDRTRRCLVVQMVKNSPAVQETWIWSWVGKIHWRRAWQPTPVFLPGESHGQRSLAGYSLWDHKELGMTEWLST